LLGVKKTQNSDITQGTQIRLPGWQCLIFVGPQHGTCYR